MDRNRTVTESEAPEADAPASQPSPFSANRASVGAVIESPNTPYASQPHVQAEGQGSVPEPAPASAGDVAATASGPHEAAASGERSVGGSARRCWCGAAVNDADTSLCTSGHMWLCKCGQPRDDEDPRVCRHKHAWIGNSLAVKTGLYARRPADVTPVPRDYLERYQRMLHAHVERMESALATLPALRLPSLRLTGKVTDAMRQMLTLASELNERQARASSRAETEFAGLSIADLEARCVEGMRDLGLTLPALTDDAVIAHVLAHPELRRALVDAMCVDPAVRRALAEQCGRLSTDELADREMREDLRRRLLDHEGAQEE